MAGASRDYIQGSIWRFQQDWTGASVDSVPLTFQKDDKIIVLSARSKLDVGGRARYAPLVYIPRDKTLVFMRLPNESYIVREKNGSPYVSWVIERTDGTRLTAERFKTYSKALNGILYLWGLKILTRWCAIRRQAIKIRVRRPPRIADGVWLAASFGSGTRATKVRIDMEGWLTVQKLSLG